MRCGADSMQVYLETVEDFTGVMYTRGSFHKQSAPCFTKPKSGKAVRSLKMKFTLDDCLTKQVTIVYMQYYIDGGIFKKYHVAISRFFLRLYINENKVIELMVLDVLCNYVNFENMYKSCFTYIRA